MFRRILFSVYMISGLLAGAAGVILAARVTAGIPTTGAGYELNAIAAAVIAESVSWVVGAQSGEPPSGS